MEERVLEFKDICIYLQHKLQIFYKGKARIVEEFDLETISFKSDGRAYWRQRISECKPLLILMSHLTKPMIVEGYNEGKEFIPLIELAKRFFDSDKYELLEDCVKVYNAGVSADKPHLYYVCPNHSRFNLIELELLSRWHFDFNNLIGQGLAEDKTKHLNK